MSKILCTFSGKYGDILWSLATAKQISIVHGQKVDFYMMPYYESLTNLLETQSYIDKCGVFPDWLRAHSNHGDQPWQPPEKYEQGYDHVYHLTYRGHPGINAPSMAVIDYIASIHGIRLSIESNGIMTPVVPFIDVGEQDAAEATVALYEQGLHDKWISRKLVTYSFNDQYYQLKQSFFTAMVNKCPELGFLDISKVSWKAAAWLCKNSIAYVGCRSANWVIANGVGQRTIITYEPHQARHASGGLGKIFGNPHWPHEMALPFNFPPEVAGDTAASLLKKAAE